MNLCTNILKPFIIIFLLLASFTPAYASENKKTNDKSKTLYHAQEIKDLKVLEKRAKQGISDDKSDQLNHVVETSLINSDTGQIEKEVTYQTTQKLLTTVSEDGQLTNSYVTTTFSGTPSTTDNASPTGVVSALGSQSDSYSGASSTVKSYSTIYWDTKGSGTTRQFRLNKATGGWTILDSTFSISNRLARIGETNISSTYYPSSNSFTYYSPSSFPWLNANAKTNYLGCTTEVTIKRGTNSWVQVFKNLIYGYPSRY